MAPTDYLRFLFALLFVLALMGGLWLVLRRLGLSGLNIAAPGQKRLKVVEILPLDARRRAVLLRRDDKEHLVILGPSGETVVETLIPVLPSAGPDEKTSR
jgi:flagellar protein FliO/FliZ